MFKPQDCTSRKYQRQKLKYFLISDVIHLFALFLTPRPYFLLDGVKWR
jgi:hypothetical protein